jgi:SOS-response transcriptional repressor LexA
MSLGGIKKMNQTEFGEHFKLERIKSGYKSQRKLASESGISNGTIARIEAGTQKVTIDTIRTLSKYLISTTFGELLEKLGYFEGLDSEKKEQMKGSYNDRLEFTEMFRELINKLAPNGEFPENIRKDIVEQLKESVDDNFTYSPGELIEFMYENGDFSDMGDLYESIKKIAARHVLIPNDPESKSGIIRDYNKQGEVIKETFIPNNSDVMVRLPLLNSIKHGQVIGEEDLHAGYILADSPLLLGGNGFAYRVNDDAMSGDRILKGDIVIVAIQENSSPNDIAVVSFTGETASLRRVKKVNEMCMLIPSNPSIQPELVLFDEVCIYGIVTEVKFSPNISSMSI